MAGYGFSHILALYCRQTSSVRFVFGLSLWLSGLIRFLSHSTCWAYLGWRPAEAWDQIRVATRGMSCRSVGLMGGML